MMASERDIIDKLVEQLQRKYDPRLFKIKTEVRISDKDHKALPLIADIVIEAREGERAFPFIVFEVKRGSFSPTGEIQLFHYMNALKTKYGVLTNGTSFIYYNRNEKNNFVEVPNIPTRLTEDISYDKRALNEAGNLSYKLTKISWSIAESLRNKARYDPIRIFSTIQKILVCKIVDEVHSEQPLFLTRNRSPKEVSMSLDQLFNKAKTIYKDVFPPYEKIELEERILYDVVSELESYSLRKTPLRIIRDAYEVTASRLLSDPRIGDYITPAKLTDFVVRLLNPSVNDRILDPAVGAGNFLTSCILRVIAESDREQSVNFKDYLKHNLFGIERNLNIATVAKVNLILQGATPQNIAIGNALSPMRPFQGQKFDIVFSHPYFGEVIDNERELGLLTTITSRKSEIAFLLLGLDYLRQGGKLAIIMPEGFLFSSSAEIIRKYLLDNYTLKAIIGLPPGLFLPHYGIKTSLLIIENRFPKDNLHPGKIFMVDIDDVNFLTSQMKDVSDQISVRYSLFSKGDKKSIEEHEKSTIFLISPGELGANNWSVKYHNIRLFSDYAASQRLDEVVEIFQGVSVSSAKYHDHPDGFTRLPYIRISDLKDGRIDPNNMKYVDPTDVKNIVNYVVKENDILLSIRGTIGKVALVNREFNNAIASSQLAILKVKDRNTLDAVYLYYTLASSKTKRQADVFKTGMFINGLSLKNLRQIRLLIPPLSQQQLIVDKIGQEEQKFRQALEYVRKPMAERISDILKGHEANG
jgi:type I restriction enzyme M protein